MTTALKLNFDFPVLQPVHIRSFDTRTTEIIELLGWSELPDRLIEVIEQDLIGFHDELTGNYCTNDTGVRNRRRTVQYWVQNYLNGICTYDTAMQMLKITF